MGKSRRAKYGQFNTNERACELTLNELKKFTQIHGETLEPSFGSGNFVSKLKLENTNIDAYEIDTSIFNKVGGINTLNEDFLFAKIEKKYDFIIGNPPYIELTYSFYNEDDKIRLKNLYKFEGRGRINLVHMFFDRSFDLLKDGGFIAYLLPSTILSSPWYNDIRKNIYENYTVHKIVENIPFDDVSISVCLLILQKIQDSSHKNIVKKENFYILTNRQFVNEITLKERGFTCSIGDVLWYNIKDNLSDIPTNFTLIYTNNIKNNSIEIGGRLRSKIDGKKQYVINYDNQIVQNCIVTPRVIGKKLRHCLITNNNNYIFENHVIIIKHEDLSKLRELDLVFRNLNGGLSEFFNSTNLTTTELLNFSY